MFARTFLTLTKVSAIIATLAVSGGCYTVNAELPGTLRGDVSSTDTEKVGSLSIETSHWFFLYGLVGETPKDLISTELKKQVQAKGADGVANMTYESEDGFIDLVIGNCSAGCVTPRTYRLKGDLVRIKKAPLPGRPAKVADLDNGAVPPAESPYQLVSDSQQY
jgi:hypothetical protein